MSIRSSTCALSVLVLPAVLAASACSGDVDGLEIPAVPSAVGTEAAANGTNGGVPDAAPGDSVVPPLVSPGTGASTDGLPPATPEATGVVTVGPTAEPPPGVIDGNPVAMEAVDSGRVTVRRLNRAEYDNTVRDLLGTNQRPGRDFLNDAPQFAFDNNADQLTLSPTQLEMYQNAAEQLASEAVAGPAREQLIDCNLAEEACMRAFVASFGLRAYRRPLASDELTAFSNLADTARLAGADDEEALRTVIEAFLMSPHFLFRVELDPDPTSLDAHPVGPYEMASRLSYLVYRSMPDQTLFDAAAADLLAEPEQLQAQLTRMLEEEYGNTFARDFVGQWLGTRLLETAQFDTDLFPSFTSELATSMRAEIEAFFDEFVRENRPVRELLAADFSYLDDNLVAHYGLAGTSDLPQDGAENVTRSVLNSPERGGGFLTMAGALSVTSYPTRTSLVKRGAWVLEKMLCTEIPPPPPEVEGFPDTPVTALSQREMLEQHRANPSCNVCHEIMDNIGIALENYDALGAYRSSEAGEPIDARGSFPGGAVFEGARSLATVVADDPRFAPCLAEHMLSYSLGRSPTAHDEPYLETIAAAGSSAGVRDLLMNIVASDTFRMRRGEPESHTPEGQTGLQP